jgi:2,3-dihydroxyphenylpropionate 1,2-dioxygenase
MRSQGSRASFGFVGAAAVPHAPQMLSLPKSEDAEQVARVRAAMQKIGDAFRSAKADLVIVVGNDHGDNFLRSVPAFTFHCGPRAEGRDGHAGWWAVDGEAGYQLVEGLQAEGFDPAFTLDAPIGTWLTIPIEFSGYSRETPVVPLFVNSYLPPQPSPERCLAFGQALSRAVTRLGRRAVFIAGGGMSHYPGTAVYSEPGPDLVTDRKLLEHISSGNLRHMLSMDEVALDRSGNDELRSWLMLAGIVGERKPDVVLFEPNWHHTYGVFGWLDLDTRAEREPLWYNAIPTRRVELARALHELRMDKVAAQAWVADAAGWAARFDLSSEEREALVALDEARLRDGFGINAMLTAGAVRGVDKIRLKKA